MIKIQSPVPVLNVITIPPGATDTQTRIVIDGVRGAIFVYEDGGPSGALIGSWASSAGTDPYGNAYPQGLNVSVGTISGVTFLGLDWVLNSNGLFFYSGTPANGNLVASITQTAGTDSHMNAYQAGFFLYQTGGNALAGMMWNTVTGSQPLLALFPDSDFGFTDHAPFILSGDENKGLSSEYQYLGMGPGAPPPASQSPEMITMWGASPDGTTSIPHFTVYGGASYDEIADFNDNGVIIENQTDGNTYKTGKKAYVANGVTVSSTSYETVLAIGTLAAGNAYHITGFANYHGNQAAGAPSFSWDGSGGLALGSQQNGYQSFALSGGGTHQDNGALGAADGPTFASATATYTYIWDVFVTVTTSGTLNITAAETISGDSWEIDYIYAQIEPY